MGNRKEATKQKNLRIQVILNPPMQSKRPFQKSTTPPKVPTAKPGLLEVSRRELRRRKLCFTCKESWQPGHRCLVKGQVHYIEVISNEDTESEGAGSENETEIVEGPAGSTLAALTGEQRYSAFRIRES